MSPTILVADDDADILSFVAPSLERAGFQVREARDGLEALRLIVNSPPDLAILDIGMPGLDGRAVLRILKNQGPDAPPVIFLTARALRSDRVAGLDAGAVDYVVKPFDMDELIARARVALRTRRG
jgi:two-component system response regulator MprA